MLLYHGSMKEFTNFEIKKEYCQREMCYLMEGLGIYLTENQEIASGFGNILYTVDIDENKILDLTQKSLIKSFINKVAKNFNIKFSRFFNIEDLIEGVETGNLSITKIGKEICDLLDSSDSFYNLYQDKITYEEDCLFEKIKSFCYKELRTLPVIKYYDKGYKENIYICIENIYAKKLNIAQIDKRED